MPIVRVTRRVHFSAGHRLHDPSLSPADNQSLFGACSNPNGHGHNYELEVTVEGEVDPRTGFVVDLARLRDVVEETVVRDVDHANLNSDVEWMRGVNPTTENLAVQIWHRLAASLERGRLVSVRVWETPRNSAEYCGE
ncbi:MAG: 6-carboxytetrahydropterin synthase [Gemmatimonadota bacterium]